MINIWTISSSYLQVDTISSYDPRNKNISIFPTLRIAPIVDKARFPNITYADTVNKSYKIW